jgi:hypothetical protein
MGTVLLLHYSFNFYGGNNMSDYQSNWLIMYIVLSPVLPIVSYHVMGLNLWVELKFSGRIILLPYQGMGMQQKNRPRVAPVLQGGVQQENRPRVAKGGCVK